MITAILAGVQAAAGIFGQIAGFNAQKKQAYNQWLHDAKVQAIQEKYRAELIEYQNVVYKQEVDHGGKVLDWQKNEFKRQGQMVANATDQIQKNLFNQYATMLTRMVEENMAYTMDTFDMQRSEKVNKAVAQTTMDARGVEGSTIEQIIGDVARQSGEALHTMELNRSATHRQLNLEAMGLKAQADQALYNIPIQSFGPSAPIQPPSPVNPVTPAAPVSMPSRGALIANVISTGIQGMSNYANWSGQTMKQAFKIG